MVLLALLVLSNAAWLHASRSVAAPSATGPDGRLPAPERVIYEYPKPVPASATPAPTLVTYRTTPLQEGERCAGNQVIRRLPNGWEGTGRPCNP